MYYRKHWDIWVNVSRKEVEMSRMFKIIVWIYVLEGIETLVKWNELIFQLVFKFLLESEKSTI